MRHQLGELRHVRHDIVTVAIAVSIDEFQHRLSLRFVAAAATGITACNALTSMAALGPRIVLGMRRCFSKA